MVAARVEMSVRPQTASSCSSWAVAGRFLFSGEVVVKCSYLGYCQML